MPIVAGSGVSCTGGGGGGGGGGSGRMIGGSGSTPTGGGNAGGVCGKPAWAAVAIDNAATLIIRRHKVHFMGGALLARTARARHASIAARSVAGRKPRRGNTIRADLRFR